MASLPLARSPARIAAPASPAVLRHRSATVATLHVNSPSAAPAVPANASATSHLRQCQPHASTPSPSPFPLPRALRAPLVAISGALLPALPALADIAEDAAGAAEAGGGGDISALVGAAAAVAGAGAVFAGVKAYGYFQLQFLVARVVGRHVPRGGAVVLDFRAGSGRNLYYLPDDVGKLLAMRPDVQPSLLKQQAISSGVLIDVLPDGLTALNRIESASVDAVITVDGFKPLTPSEAATAAAGIARILKPSRPLIFVEACESGSPEVKDTSRPSFSFLPDAVLPLYEQVNYDYVLPAIDRHVVGVAVRSSDSAPVSPGGPSKSSSASGFSAGKTGRKQ
ncbi:hypothetical protein CLOM_g7305 [Closterium sp. NIES-68]|nr:hypothetical protein CLOM_g7305 [Closterium sp. NIES-68]GJP81291.1 hypothetical protein CLOP_g11448 [Closterium sp. NIES-67]